MIIGVIVSVTPDASANGIAKGVNTAADGQPLLVRSGDSGLSAARVCRSTLGENSFLYPKISTDLFWTVAIVVLGHGPNF